LKSYCSVRREIGGNQDRGLILADPKALAVKRDTSERAVKVRGCQQIDRIGGTPQLVDRRGPGDGTSRGGRSTR